jgi:two-component system sensor histidine kinase KdpD
VELGRIARARGGYPLAVASVVLAAAVLFPFRPLLSSSTVMLLFVPVIIGVARAGGVRASATAAVLAFLALDFFFVPPYYRLNVASIPEWLGLLVFLIVALVSGQQTARLRNRERAAVRRQEELALLNRVSFRIASEKSVTSIAEFIAGQVTEVLGARRAALYARGDGGPPVCLAHAGLLRASSGEVALVSWVLRTSKAIGMPFAQGVPYDQRVVSVGASDALPGVIADGVFIPLQTTTSLEGVLFAEPSAPLTADDGRLLAAVANLAATSLERQSSKWKRRTPKRWRRPIASSPRS